MKDDLGSTLLWTALTFGGLLVWCVVLPYIVKLYDYCFRAEDAGARPPLVPEAEIQTEYPNNAESLEVRQDASAASEVSGEEIRRRAPSMDYATVFCPDAKLITSESYDSLNELPVAIERRGETKYEDMSSAAHDEMPIASGSRIVVMNVISGPQH